MRIVLTTDHTGIERLQALLPFLTNLGHECQDYGPKTFVLDDDYPDLIFPAARDLAAGKFDCGIIMGGSGQGEAIVANRVKGVRCALYYGPSPMLQPLDIEGRLPQDEFEIIRLSKQHNNANMLSLASRFLSQGDIEKAVSIWLATPFSNSDRHIRRIQKIDQI